MRRMECDALLCEECSENHEDCEECREQNFKEVKGMLGLSLSQMGALEGFGMRF